MRNVREEFWVLRGPFDRSIKKDIKGAFKAKLPGEKKAYYYWEKIKGYAVKFDGNTFYLVYNRMKNVWMTYEKETGMKIAEDACKSLKQAEALVIFRYKGTTDQYGDIGAGMGKFPRVSYVIALLNRYKYQIG